MPRWPRHERDPRPPRPSAGAPAPARRRGALLRRHRRRAPARRARRARGRRGARRSSPSRARSRSRDASPSRSMRPRRPGRPYDAVVALGCVIRGETGHYDIVAGESARALMDLSVARRIPLAQRHPHRRERGPGLARARVGELNKGGGAAEAALAVLRIKRAVSRRRADGDGKDRRAPRRPPRCRPGALPDGRRRQGRDRRARRVRGPLDRPRGRGHRLQAGRDAFFRDILSGVVARAARHRPQGRQRARRRLAAEAGRGGAARDPARRRLRADVPQGRAGPRRHHRICRRRARLLRRGRAGLVNAVLDPSPARSRAGELEKKRRASRARRAGKVR